MIGKLKELIRLAGGEWLVSFTTRDDPRKLFDDLHDLPVRMEIKKASGKRSLSANNFCWALCSDIGKAMTPPESKEEVYRKAIKAVGVYTPYPLKNEDVDEVMRRWKSNGEGWFIEVVDNSKIDGYKLIHMYYGTSTYTVDEMRILLDWLIDQAEQMEIAIPLSKDEERRVLEQWGARASCKKATSDASSVAE